MKCQKSVPMETKVPHQSEDRKIMRPCRESKSEKNNILILLYFIFTPPFSCYPKSKAYLRWIASVSFFNRLI